MEIRIRSKEGPNLWIPLPTGLIFNRLTAPIAARAMAQYGAGLSAGQLTRFFAAVKRYKRTHPDWVLAEVQSADGDYVLVKL